MENLEKPANEDEFKNNVAARREATRSGQRIKFSDDPATESALAAPALLSFRVADYMQPADASGSTIEFVDYPKTWPAALSRARAVRCAASARLPKAWAVSASRR